jgi:hypothetical protein
MRYTEFFSPPDGDIIANPDILFLRILFLYVDQEYWNSGSGDSYIDYKDEHKSSRLQILFSHEFGFYLRYQSWGKDLHSLNNGDYSKITEVYVGGNPIVLPVKFFIDRESAFEAVELFCETGEHSPLIEWGADGDIEWDWEKYLR